MPTFADAIGNIVPYTRQVLFVAVALAALGCSASWAVRTRRVSPFGALGRFARARIDPLLSSVESSVLRAGGSNASVPWWGLAAAVVLGILAQSLLIYVITELMSVSAAVAAGPRGILRGVVRLVLVVLQAALMLRVLSSWLPVMARVRWLRWTFVLTDPLLAPLRAIIPSVGPFDITPLVLYYLLQIVGGFIVSSI